MSAPYADVAIPFGVDKLFTYSIPPEFGGMAKTGARVLVEFGRRTVIGWIVELHSRPPGRESKPLLDILDTEPLLVAADLKLCRWIAGYYLAPLGEVIRAAQSPGLSSPGKRVARLTDPDARSGPELHEATPVQSAILRELAKSGELTIPRLKSRVRAGGFTSALNELRRRGQVAVEDRLPRLSTPHGRSELIIELDEERRQALGVWLAEPAAKSRTRLRQEGIVRAILGAGAAIPVRDLMTATGAPLSSIRTLARKKLFTLGKRSVARDDGHGALLPPPREIILNVHQQAALDCLRAGIAEGRFKPFLLYGVTGSGKTQVYIDAIRDVLARGKTAIVLVPEISLTPQIVGRFRQQFGDLVAAFHSRMSAGERFDAWQATRRGKTSVVIGPRSAVFAPLKNLGLIVVDEEQESSYKQGDQAPRYHARDVAIVRAAQSDAVIVLGSATPSCESFANAASGKYTLLELPERADNARLPAMTLVDMTAERRNMLAAFRQERKHESAFNPARAKAVRSAPETGSLSRLLREKIADRLERKEGIILLQNRRGFSTALECPDCGNVETCPNCNIPMTFHRTTVHLRCHYCGIVRQPPQTCPSCASPDIRHYGFGTQRVEEELREYFPGAAILRMDLDTTVRRGTHAAILKKFSEGRADILLGTQMVAKGLDFSRVTLVGVISADTQMLLPDFRAGERTFQLLTQVAGRAGRSTLAGEVVIQTHQPGHGTLKHVVLHDFRGFYDEEMRFREELCYPPFSRLILIEFHGELEKEVIRQAGAFAGILRRHSRSMTILGPAAAAIPRLRGEYRWHLVLKSPKAADPAGKKAREALRAALSSYDKAGPRRRHSVRLIVDVDPAGMM